MAFAPLLPPLDFDLPQQSQERWSIDFWRGRREGESSRTFTPGRARWVALDDVNLEEVFNRCFPVLQSCLFQVRRFIQATRVALETLHNVVLGHDTLMETRGWKLFILLPFMLLRRPHGQGRVVSKVSQVRRRAVGWRGTSPVLKVWRRPHIGADSIESRAVAACQKIKLGEISRARQCLTGASLAPRTEATFQLLQARRPQVVVRELPEAVRAFEPESPVTVDRKIFLKCLKSAPRGASPYEHLKTLLDDTDTMELLFETITSLSERPVHGRARGRDRIWPNLIWPSSFGRIWPNRIWPIPHLAKLNWPHLARQWPTLASPILANPFLAIVFGQPILANPFLANLFFCVVLLVLVWIVVVCHCVFVVVCCCGCGSCWWCGVVIGLDHLAP